MLPWLVLLVGLVATGLFAQQISEAALVREQARFQTAVEEARATLESQAHQYITLLEGTAAHLTTAESVTRDDFEAYIEQLGLDEHAPAISGIGFARLVPEAYLDQFEESVRAQGEPDFTVAPRLAGGAHVVVEYFLHAQSEARGLLGYNLAHDAAFVEALNRARDGGDVTVTGRLSHELSGAETPDPAPFAAVAPVFEGDQVPATLEERQHKLVGFVFAPFSAARLVDGMFYGHSRPRLELEVFDGPQADPSRRLMSTRSSPDDDADAPFNRMERTNFADRDWLILFTASPYFERTQQQSLASSVFMIGAAVSVLLFVLLHRDAVLRRRSDLVHAGLLKRERAARTEAQAAADLLAIAEDAASAGVWEVDVVAGTAKWSESLYRLFGVDPAGYEPTLENWFLCTHAEDRPLVRETVRTAIENHGSLSIEYRVSHPQLGDRWLLQIGRTFGITEVGRPVRMAGIVLDITARKESEEHQKLLLAELNHRVKNTLAIVQSIASQTTKHSESLESFRESFEGRLRALAKAHGLATQSHWKSIDLRSLVNLALAPYANESGDNIAIEGPAVSLKTAAALALSMILHELSTNAAKYGALSVQNGLTAVRWEVLDDGGARVVHLTWRETGGPTVRAAGRRGFGSHLIERSVEYDLGGSALIDLRPEGLWCEMVFPLTPNVGTARLSRMSAAV